jgi:hypothetical protein
LTGRRQAVCRASGWQKRSGVLQPDEGTVETATPIVRPHGLTPIRRTVSRDRSWPLGGHAPRGGEAAYKGQYAASKPIRARSRRKEGESVWRRARPCIRDVARTRARRCSSFPHKASLTHSAFSSDRRSYCDRLIAPRVPEHRRL